MIEYRPFRNIDPPGLAEVWRSQSSLRGLMQPMSVAVLERFVFSRPYFDRHGLIVAVEGSKILGFAHAGFGPSADQNALATTEGVTSLVLVRPEADATLGSQLLERCESYLRERGATALFAGGCPPLAPFYYGLHGGSEPSGVLNSEPRGQALLGEFGYAPAQRTLVLHRDLSQFRPVVDRQQMQIRRHTMIQTIVDPPTSTWWEACLLEPLERVQCRLVPRDGGAPLASVDFWNMETMVGTWGVRAVGVVNLVVGTEAKRQGNATYLLGEALRQFHTQGLGMAEAHVAVDNSAGLALFQKLGFNEVDQAVHYRKA